VFFGDRRVSAALARRPPEGSAAQERCRLSSSPTDRARGGLGWVGWVSRALCPVPSRPARSAPRPRAFGSPPGGDQTQPLCAPNLTDLRPLHACHLRLHASSLRFPSRFTRRVAVAVRVASCVTDHEEAGRGPGRGVAIARGFPLVFTAFPPYRLANGMAKGLVLSLRTTQGGGLVGVIRTSESPGR
jgi:hypothetical protein